MAQYQRVQKYLGADSVNKGDWVIKNMPNHLHFWAEANLP